MNTPNTKKPLLQAVVDILDVSLRLLQKHPNRAEKDAITREIEKIKKQIENYEKEKAKKIPYETINWEEEDNSEDNSKAKKLLSELNDYFR